jgi:hypothetical protein
MKKESRLTYSEVASWKPNFRTKKAEPEKLLPAKPKINSGKVATPERLEPASIKRDSIRVKVLPKNSALDDELFPDKNYQYSDLNKPLIAAQVKRRKCSLCGKPYLQDEEYNNRVHCPECANKIDDVDGGHRIYPAHAATRRIFVRKI